MDQEAWRAKVEGWLKEIGTTFSEIKDARAHWHLRIDYPLKSGHTMHVVSPKDRTNAIVIASGMEISHDHRKAFDDLDDDSKAEFLDALRCALNQVSVDFQLEGISEELDCPKLFQVSVTRYEEGCTLDSFAHSVGAVFKTELNALWIVQRHLQPRSFGDGRFDFKRLGLP
jgi:hypothetical protein